MKIKSEYMLIVILLVLIALAARSPQSQAKAVQLNQTEQIKRIGNTYIYDFSNGVLINKTFALTSDNSTRDGYWREEQLELFLDCGKLRQGIDACDNTSASALYTSRLNKGFTTDSYFYYKRVSPSGSIVSQSRYYQSLSIEVTGRKQLQMADGIHDGYGMLIHPETNIVGSIGDLFTLTWYLKIQE